jgi:hypothetical protein
MQQQKNPQVANELMGMYKNLAVIQANPFLKENQKMDKVLALTCKLSDIPFNYLAENIIKEMKLGGDKQFANADLETESIITKYPRIAPFKNTIKERVVISRQKAKLEV